jgi:hypothetical protein
MPAQPQVNLTVRPRRRIMYKVQFTLNGSKWEDLRLQHFATRKEAVAAKTQHQRASQQLGVRYRVARV